MLSRSAIRLWVELQLSTPLFPVVCSSAIFEVQMLRIASVRAVGARSTRISAPRAVQQKRTFFWPFSSKPAKPKFDESLLNVIVCPLTKSALRFDAAANELVNDEWGIRYPVRDGTPILLVSEAKRILPDGAEESDALTAVGVVEVKNAIREQQSSLSKPAGDQMTPHNWKPQ